MVAPFDMAWTLLKDQRMLADGITPRQGEFDYGQGFTTNPKDAKNYMSDKYMPMSPCKLCEQPEFADELNDMGICRACAKEAEQAKQGEAPQQKTIRLPDGTEIPI